MKCKAPFRKGLLEAGCGQCTPCRINRQRTWAIRIVLEAGQHEHSSFVTLTYSDELRPADGCVSVREGQLFLKRLRRRIGSFRYFFVGEYGERTWRPHYHAILFGVRNGSGVAEAWGKGFVSCSGVGRESASYVAGYCIKGLTSEARMKFAGRSLAPEFALMSRKPGIGALSADRIGEFYGTYGGSAALVANGSVSSVVRFDQRLWPIGRYLRGRVNDFAGVCAEVLSGKRQLEEGAVLRSMDQSELNDYLEACVAVSERSGFQAEARVKRKSLERRVKV